MDQSPVILCVLGAWLVLSLVVGLALARMIRNRDRQHPRQDADQRPDPAAAPGV
jgi:hypothetical protein